MIPVETPRLIVHELTLDDAPFILELLNEPAFHRYIGDKGVRSLDDARHYLTTGPLASYAKHGFGLWLVALKDRGTPIGLCGPLRRDTLEHADLGFALLARYGGQGYAHEAATAVLAHARQVLNLDRILAITAPENPP